eukprot:TRINITY_DN61798_c0_g1_i1.p1 TRINITY_DN61798_c0_g1~~TRINITY_DN61798_c0_g1_i1.p1  ORF type:complete len:382 (-),score=-15.31 TRINITY_DN61798_c0_g1_i1:5-1150(-)
MYWTINSAFIQFKEKWKVEKQQQSKVQNLILVNFCGIKLAYKKTQPNPLHQSEDVKSCELKRGRKKRGNQCKFAGCTARAVADPDFCSKHSEKARNCKKRYNSKRIPYGKIVTMEEKVIELKNKIRKAKSIIKYERLEKNIILEKVMERNDTLIRIKEAIADGTDAFEAVDVIRGIFNTDKRLVQSLNIHQQKVGLLLSSHLQDDFSSANDDNEAKNSEEAGSRQIQAQALEMGLNDISSAEQLMQQQLYLHSFWQMFYVKIHAPKYSRNTSLYSQVFREHVLFCSLILLTSAKYSQEDLVFFIHYYMHILLSIPVLASQLWKTQPIDKGYQVKQHCIFLFNLGLIAYTNTQFSTCLHTILKKKYVLNSLFFSQVQFQLRQ